MIILHFSSIRMTSRPACPRRTRLSASSATSTDALEGKIKHFISLFSYDFIVFGFCIVFSSRFPSQFELKYYFQKLPISPTPRRNLCTSRNSASERRRIAEGVQKSRGRAESEELSFVHDAHREGRRLQSHGMHQMQDTLLLGVRLSGTDLKIPSFSFQK